MSAGRRGRAVAFALALALGLGACGGDDTGSASTTTDAVPTTPAPTTTVSVPESGRAFCDLTRSYLERLPRVAAAVRDPAAIRQILADTEAVVQQTEAAAPPELKADVALLAVSSRELVAQLERVDFDFTRLAPADVARIQTPEVQAAAQRLAAYNKDVCGVG